jgi:Glycosyltransferase family 87
MIAEQSPVSSLFRKITQHPLFGAAALAVSLGAMLVFGLLGVGRGGESFFDVRYPYIAAKCWLAGLNPYDYAVFQSVAQANGLDQIEVFAYPPQSFVLGALLAPFSYAAAKGIMATLSLIALAALAFWGRRLLALRHQAARLNPARVAGWLIPAIVVGNPFTAHVLWTGQSSLIVGAMVVTAWQLLGSSALLAGVMLGFASLKPQLVFLVMLWICLERRWRVLLAFGLSLLLFSAVPLLQQGALPALSDWWQSTQAYQLEPTKAMGLSYNTNLKSLLLGLGLAAPGLAVFGLGAIAFTGLLWWLHRQGRLEHSDVLGLLLPAQLLLLLGRDYDIVILLPLLTSLWWHVRSVPLAQIGSFGLMVLLFVPHRLVEKLAPGPLLYWRTAVLLGLTVWLLIAALRSRPLDSSQLAPDRKAAAQVP